MERTEMIFEIINLSLILGSVLLVWLTIYLNQRWNKKKVTQEILNNFIIGEIPDLNTKIRIEYGCEVYNRNNDYKKFIKSCGKKKKQGFDDTLIRILNIFEVIGLNIKNKIVVEGMCYDYLGWFFTEYYRFSKDLMLQKRKIAGNSNVLITFEKYAMKWTKRIEEDKDK
jgi:hypothetical protein